MDDRFELQTIATQAGFGHDFEAVSLGRNRVIEILPQALAECQRRFMNPFQKFSIKKVMREQWGSCCMQR